MPDALRAMFARPDVVAFYREAGRRGGLKGGVARMASITPEERQELGRKAARARWARLKKRAAR
jgi:hypothetical protein